MEAQVTTMSPPLILGLSTDPEAGSRILRTMTAQPGMGPGEAFLPIRTVLESSWQEICSFSAESFSFLQRGFMTVAGRVLAVTQELKLQGVELFSTTRPLKTPLMRIAGAVVIITAISLTACGPPTVPSSKPPTQVPWKPQATQPPPVGSGLLPIEQGWHGCTSHGEVVMGASYRALILCQEGGVDDCTSGDVPCVGPVKPTQKFCYEGGSNMVLKEGPMFRATAPEDGCVHRDYEP